MTRFLAFSETGQMRGIAKNCGAIDKKAGQTEKHQKIVKTYFLALIYILRDALKIIYIGGCTVGNKTLDSSFKSASADIWRWFVKWMEKGPEDFTTAEWEEESHEIESIWRKYADTPAKHYAERYAQICHAELTRCFDEAEREQYKQLTMPCGKEWAEK